MNLRIKSFLMLSLLAIAVQAFPRLARAEGYLDEAIEPEKSQYCFLLNEDGTELILPCDSQNADLIKKNSPINSDKAIINYQ